MRPPQRRILSRRSGAGSPNRRLILGAEVTSPQSLWAAQSVRVAGKPWQGPLIRRRDLLVVQGESPQLKGTTKSYWRLRGCHAVSHWLQDRRAAARMPMRPARGSRDDLSTAPPCPRFARRWTRCRRRRSRADRRPREFHRRGRCRDGAHIGSARDASRRVSGACRVRDPEKGASR